VTIEKVMSTMFRTRTARHRKSRFGIRATLATTGAVLAGVLLALAGNAGSYALWNTTAPITDASVTSGTQGITIKYGSGIAGSTAAIPTSSWSSLLPGDFVGQEVTVANTGNISSTMSAKLNAAVPYEVRLAAGNCPATVISGAALTTTATTYGTMPAATSSVACIQVLLPAGAAASVQGTTSAFTITITADQ
jgi:hypothetical protein